MSFGFFEIWDHLSRLDEKKNKNKNNSDFNVNKNIDISQVDINADYLPKLPDGFVYIQDATELSPYLPLTELTNDYYKIVVSKGFINDYVDIFKRKFNAKLLSKIKTNITKAVKSINKFGAPTEVPSQAIPDLPGNAAMYELKIGSIDNNMARANYFTHHINKQLRIFVFTATYVHEGEKLTPQERTAGINDYFAIKNYFKK